MGEVVPGVPLVLSAPSGSGRTVLCLQLAARALARGRHVAYLTSQPPRLLLGQTAVANGLWHDAFELFDEVVRDYGRTRSAVPRHERGIELRTY